ncbi:MAG: DUF3887 domain-containing protein [Theionarchaea archaeon]|nr:DUF3887 domain-containing protein [Theionarchaea archaeon]MBU7036551.1 DUF3887 domain-containing protein [Theionarchaea archaeon]
MILKKTKKSFAVWLVLTGLLATGCIGQKSETPIEGEESQEWFARAQPMAENILIAVETGDYQSFIRDFSEQMVKEMPEKNFLEVKEKLYSQVGSYQSLSTLKTTEQRDYVIVYFTAHYEKDDVTVKLVYRKGDSTYKIEGLWFA